MIHVSFIDSGVGGLVYCDAFLQAYPDVEVSYIADTQFFPYGNHEAEHIQQRLLALCQYVIDTCKSNIIVLACNTASVSALQVLRATYSKKLSVNFVGVVPAIKPVFHANGKRMYMMSTTATKKNKYTDALLQEFADDMQIFLRGFPELVESIEKMVLSHSDAYGQYVASLLEKIVIEIKELNIDSVVLACTHFLFIKKQLERLLPEGITIYHSLEGVVKQIGAILHAIEHKTGQREGSTEQETANHTQTDTVNACVPTLYITDVEREEEFKQYAQSSQYQYGGIIVHGI